MSITHGGSGSSYSTAPYNCRCDECRAAHAERIKRRRAQRAAELQADPTLAPHGDVSTYKNWGCRCMECTIANAEACKRWRETR